MRKQLNLLPAEKWFIPCFSQLHFLVLFFQFILLANHIDCLCLLFVVLTNEMRWSIFAIFVFAGVSSDETWKNFKDMAKNLLIIERNVNKSDGQQ